MDYLCVFLNFQIFVYSLIFLLIPRFIPLWSEKMLSMISVLLGLSGCVLSWWLSYVYLRRGHILLVVVFCKCQLQPVGWLCSVLLNPCWPFVNTYFFWKTIGVESGLSWKHCAFGVGTVHYRGSAHGAYIMWDIVQQVWVPLGKKQMEPNRYKLVTIPDRVRYNEPAVRAPRTEWLTLARVLYTKGKQPKQSREAIDNSL